ncbi:MAG: hypothetical protein JW984_10950 [Deltaproteobacteria bacterium]|uniref:Uncharacterized protein n=1 Tax=Candidatus Zymogenus saltonus TaxID=2844893 RepID=A0A9D8KH40_9DELT|nr:hypothetical protein [Candidatus Zymogenus saltonus]
MKTILLIICGVIIGMLLLCTIFYIVMSPSKKRFLKAQMKSAHYMLPRYFV